MNLKGNLTSKGLQGSIGKSRMQGILGTNPAAIPITVDNALSLSSTNPVQNRVITAAITNRLLSDDVKNALLQIAQKVAYIDADGQDYYDALYDALYPPVGLDSISAVFDAGGATIYNTDTLDDLKQYLTVTAYYTSGDSEVVDSYTLSGSMDAGTQTITVSYGGKTTTFTVTVVALDVESIDAVFTQGSAYIYDTDSLDTLKQYLVVTANYSDSTTETVTGYILSGTLAEGTSVITVTYSGKTTTFTVTVSQRTIRVFKGKGVSGTSIVDNANRALTEILPMNEGDSVTFKWETSVSNVYYALKPATDTNTVSSVGSKTTPQAGTDDIWSRTNTEYLLSTGANNGVPREIASNEIGIRFIFKNASADTSPISATLDGMLIINGIPYHLVEANIADFE